MTVANLRRVDARTVFWAAGCLAVVALAAAVAWHTWNLPDESWLAWREYAAGTITYEEAVGWYWWCRVGLTAFGAAMVFAPGAFALLAFRPGRSGVGGAEHGRFAD